MKHKDVTLVIVILLSFAVSPSLQQDIKCHYSCLNCTKSQHQFCKSCIDGYEFEIVKNPQDMPVEYRDTKVATGVCRKDPGDSSTVSGVNGLGITLLICGLLLLPLTKSNLLFYIISSLQSLGLIRLLQISWLNPSAYLLKSFQYLSPCNLFTSQIKSTSWIMKLYSYYYIDELYIQPEIQKSLLFVGVLDIVVIGLIIIVHLIRILKRKYFMQNCRNLFCFSDWGTKNIINYLNCLFYFLIQETILSFVVGLQFTKANSVLIGTIVAYSILTVIFCAYTYRIKIALFQNRLIQYYSYVKKIMYPIFIVVPFQYQYFLIVFMAINCVLETFFDYQIKSYPIKSRWTGFRILQFITVLFLGIFYGVDVGASSEQPARTMNIILTIALALNVSYFFIEIILSIKERLQAPAQDQLKGLSPSKNHLPQNSTYDREQHNNTLGLTSTKRQQRRESTEADLVEGQQVREGIAKLNESIDEPPKADRETKDSSFKKSREEQQKQFKASEGDQIQHVQLEKISQVPQPKMSKENSKKKMKANELKSELKKRYGV